MYDSRQFLQFVVERKLEFDFRRNLYFDHTRDLVFDHDRDLLFDHNRAILFGQFGPVFRGRACPKCRQLVHPLEDTCRACGTHISARMKPSSSRLRAQTAVSDARTRPRSKPRSKPSQKRKQKPASRPKTTSGETMVCPNCALKIPGDSVYCPRCRVKISEWRQYLQELRRWEDEVQRSGRGQSPRYPPQRYEDDYYRRR
jgi:RNA polymerase subunit RPABC4/transcription elongation factor Spt4